MRVGNSVDWEILLFMVGFCVEKKLLRAFHWVCVF